MEFKVAEQGHVVQILTPLDGGGTATRTSGYVNMKNYSHCDIILGVGVSAGTATAILMNSETTSGGDAIAAAYYAEETTTGDVLGARTTLATTGLTIAATNSIFYVISVEATDLQADHPYVGLALSGLDSGTVTCAYAILSGARYASDQSATVIA